MRPRRGVRPGDRVTGGLDLGQHARVLRRLSGEQLQHAPPPFQGPARVARSLGATGFGGQLLELRRVNQLPAAGTGQQRLGQLGAARHADARRDGEAADGHRVAGGGAAPGAAAMRGGVAGPRRNGPDSGTRRLSFQAS